MASRRSPRSMAPRSAAGWSWRSAATFGSPPAREARPARGQARPAAGRRRHRSACRARSARSRRCDDRRRQPVSAAEALKQGLVDAIARGRPGRRRPWPSPARLVAEAPARAGSRPRDKLAGDRDLEAFDAEAARADEAARGLERRSPASRRCATRSILPFDEALAPSEAFDALVAGDQSKAQRHLFFAEREAAKFPGLAPASRARPRSRSASSAPAPWAAASPSLRQCRHRRSTLIEINREALERGLAAFGSELRDAGRARPLTRPSASRRLRADQRQRRLRRRAPTRTSSSRRCSRTWRVKQQVFSRPRQHRQARRHPGHQHLLPRHRRRSPRRPAGRTTCVGMHFFSPAQRHAAAGDRARRETAPDVLATAARSCANDRQGAGGRRRLPRLRRQPHARPPARPRPSTCCSKAPRRRRSTTRSPPSACRWDRSRWPTSPASTSAGATARPQARRAVIADALCEAGPLRPEDRKGFYRYEGGAQRRCRIRRSSG